MIQMFYFGIQSLQQTLNFHQVSIQRKIIEDILKTTP